MKPSGSQLDRWELDARSSVDPALINELAIRAGCFGAVHRKALCLAFAAGADQELRACELYLAQSPYPTWAKDLRAARRPKPLSQAEQATAELDEAVMRGDCITTTDAMPSLRAALKRLKELEAAQ